MNGLFHLAFKVRDLDQTRRFYGDVLSMHLGEHLVPMPHFGLALALPDWQALAQRLQAADIRFVLPPQVRFEGQPGEQWTMFFCDPCGNPIEIKGFRSLSTVYAT
jgi:extradiol dioxygenase family protein